MSKKTKWNPKSVSRPRFYMNGIWCAVIDHNHNVDREVLRDAKGIPLRRWSKGGTLKHSGRWYTTTMRVHPNSSWQIEFRRTMLEQARSLSAGKQAPVPGQAFLVHACDTTVTVEVGAVMEELLQTLEAEELPHVVETDASGEIEIAEAGGGSGVGLAGSLAGCKTESAAIEAAVGSVLEHLVQRVVAAAPKPSEAHEYIARVAAEATSAAQLRGQRAGPAVQLVEPVQELDATKAKGLKVPELKDALGERGLETTGKKAELLARLLTAISEAEEERQEEELAEEDGSGEEPGASSGAADGSSRGKAGLAAPTAIAEAAGIALQWYLTNCPICRTQLQVRLPQPYTQLCCTHCSALFVAPNTHLDRLPTVPLWVPKGPRKRSQMELAQASFVREAIPRAKATHPNLGPAQRLSVIMREQWPAHKASLVIAEPPAPAPSATSVSREVVVAQPFDPSSGAVASEGVQMLGLLATQLTPLPPPAFMPLAQMQKRKRQVPGKKEHVLRPKSAAIARTPATRPTKPRRTASKPSHPARPSKLDDSQLPIAAPSSAASSTAPSSTAPLSERSPNVPSHSGRQRRPSAKAAAAAAPQGRAVHKRKAADLPGKPCKQQRLSAIARRLNDVGCGCVFPM